MFIPTATLLSSERARSVDVVFLKRFAMTLLRVGSQLEQLVCIVCFCVLCCGALVPLNGYELSGSFDDDDDDVGREIGANRSSNSFRP